MDELILFSSDRMGTWDIYTMNQDGTGVERLTDSEGREKEPSLSRDAFIVYESSEGIVRVDFDGSNPVVLNPTGRLPEWCPEGRRVVFIDRVDWPGHEYGISKVFCMNYDGSDLVQITNDTDYHDFWPVWSPDGQRILWRRTPIGGTDELWVMAADGSGKQVIASDGGYARAEWSPSGDEIAYDHWSGQRWSIFVMASDGSSVRQVTPDDADGYGDYEVTWSPNGEKLLFVRDYVVGYSDQGFPNEWQSDLCVLDLDSGKVTHLTSGPAADTCPSWNRVPGSVSRSIVRY